MEETGDPAVLLIEDDSDILATWEECLRARGFRHTIFMVKNGEDALDVWTRFQTRIHVVALDGHIEGSLDECEIARRIRAERDDIPIIACSDQVERNFELRRAGCSHTDVKEHVPQLIERLMRRAV